MCEKFKAYANKAAFATTDNEMMITLYIDRPSLNDKNEVYVTRDEVGTIILTHEYANTFKNAIEKNLLAYAEGKAKKVQEIEEKERKKNENEVR
jgi:hypothetical protein